MNGAKDKVMGQGETVKERLAEAAHLQAIEGNPLSPDEIAMFEMFERKGWPPEERRAYIARRFQGSSQQAGHQGCAGAGRGGEAVRRPASS